jgi:DNA-binding transcriptional LysR family regulator
MIKLQLLAHALALSHHGNFQRAAAARHLLQLALSRSIQSLEEELGVPLFDRRSVAVTPTLYGEAPLWRAAMGGWHGRYWQTDGMGWPVTATGRTRTDQ